MSKLKITSWISIKSLELADQKSVIISAWLWGLNLVIFPVWYFASDNFAKQIQILGIVLVWILLSVVFLWIWLGTVNKNIIKDWKSVPLPAWGNHVFILVSVGMAILNLIPARYPLTNSGDEDVHAGTFRTIGRIGDTILGKVLPGPTFIWILLSILLLTALIIVWLRLLQTKYKHRAIVFAYLALVAVMLISVIVFLQASTWLLQANESAGLNFSPAQWRGLVRFQPLTKFLWLPAGLLGWRSLFALRLPSVVCYLLAGIVLFRTIALRTHSSFALMPASFLLVLPGMFYYGHLVYLTSPMLLTWCVALYFYEKHQLTSDKRFLIWTAIALNAGTLVRLETAYFALAIIAHWAWKQRYTKLTPYTVFDGLGLAWFGVSVVPLWSKIDASRPFQANWQNLFDPARLFAVANDYPFHIGIVACSVLLFVLMALVGSHRPSLYSPTLVQVSCLVIGITYILFTWDWIVPDHRSIGLIRFGANYQTSHRFLVSWSPFVAILLSEGVVRIFNAQWRILGGIFLGIVLLAQSTVWAAPMTLPEYTSLRLRPGSETPYLPMDQVIQYVSKELATPQTRILLSNNLGGFYINSFETQGVWLREPWAPRGQETLSTLIAYCELNKVDIVILPMVWMDSFDKNEEIARLAMESKSFKALRVFTYLGQPAVLITEFHKDS